MDLVMDANILFSALISSKGKTRDLLFLDELNLFAPEFLLIEFEKHKQDIIKKSKISNEDLELAISIILSRIKLVPFSEFKTYIKEAKEICPDPNDIEYFALALSKSIPFWSDDKPLKKQFVVRIISTTELIKKFEKNELTEESLKSIENAKERIKREQFLTSKEAKKRLGL